MKQDLDEIFAPQADTANVADDSALDALGDLAKRKKELEISIKSSEDYLKELKEELREIDQKGIPDLLAKYGIDEIKVKGIGKVSAKIDYRASVKDEDWNRFKDWLKETGQEDLMKEQTILVNLPDDEKAELFRHGYEYTVKNGMHWQTLSKVARNLRENGEDEPEFLNIFTQYKTVVK